MPKNTIPANTFFDAKVEANTFFDAKEPKWKPILSLMPKKAQRKAPRIARKPAANSML